MHGISSRSPLIFNETYNHNWKIFSKKNTDSVVTNNNKGDFISENIAGTIQNNNLPNGDLLETDNTNLIKLIDEKEHESA
jgi:hypothetical protein